MLGCRPRKRPTFIADCNDCSMIVHPLGDNSLPINLQTSFTLTRGPGLAPGPVQLVLKCFLVKDFGLLLIPEVLTPELRAAAK